MKELEDINKSLKAIYNHLDTLSGRMNRIEFLFEKNRDANNKIVAAMQSNQPDVLRMALEATEKPAGAFK